MQAIEATNEPVGNTGLAGSPPPARRNGSRSRVKRRCQATGASHAVYRKFQLNRISFRNMALQGLLPGVTKASW